MLEIVNHKKILGRGFVANSDQWIVQEVEGRETQYRFKCVRLHFGKGVGKIQFVLLRKEMKDGKHLLYNDAFYPNKTSITKADLKSLDTFSEYLRNYLINKNI